MWAIHINSSLVQMGVKLEVSVYDVTGGELTLPLKAPSVTPLPVPLPGAPKASLPGLPKLKLPLPKAPLVAPLPAVPKAPLVAPLPAVPGLPLSVLPLPNLGR
eukprot:GHVR01054431.1.p1 GENE.GHVR01054431.1~~GHVR01054431.1.p1  ORF type:complete len:103 (+),score=20.91 GHVR01054431.1:962-1270(+)